MLTCPFNHRSLEKKNWSFGFLKQKLQDLFCDFSLYVEILSALLMLQTSTIIYL